MRDRPAPHRYSIRLRCECRRKRRIHIKNINDGSKISRCFSENCFSFRCCFCACRVLVYFFMLKLSFFCVSPSTQIYMERIRDLLTPSNDDLKIRENLDRGVYVEDLSEQYVTDGDQITLALKQGSNLRSTAATDMNERSSRSHSIFVLTVEQRNVEVRVWWVCLYLTLCVSDFHGRYMYLLCDTSDVEREARPALPCLSRWVREGEEDQCRGKTTGGS